MEVLPGIYQFKIPIPDNPLGNLLSYLVKGEKGYLLIDAGWPAPEGMRALAGQLQELGLGFRDISSVVITHFHMDHAGLAPRIRELSGAQVAMHRAETAYLPSGGGGSINWAQEMLPWLRRHGMPEAELDLTREGDTSPWQRFQGQAFVVDRVLEGGEVLDLGTLALEVIWTPGHAPGHVCLYDRDRKTLFSGDHVLPVITPHVSLTPRSPLNPLADFLSSLDKVGALEVELVLPAHEHIFKNCRQRIAGIKHHHQARLEAMLRALDGGEKSAYQIAERTPWDLAPWPDMEAKDRRSAVNETLSHLEYLRQQGRVAGEEQDGLVFFRPA